MKTYYCFSCKKDLPIAKIKKEGESKKGKWYLCFNCSDAYKKKIDEEKVTWKVGPCPRCLSPDKLDDGGYPLRTNFCRGCGYKYTLWLEEPQERTREDEKLDQAWLQAAKD